MWLSQKGPWNWWKRNVAFRYNRVCTLQFYFFCNKAWFTKECLTIGLTLLKSLWFWQNIFGLVIKDACRLVWFAESDMIWWFIKTATEQDAIPIRGDQQLEQDRIRNRILAFFAATGVDSESRFYQKMGARA